MEKNMFFVIPKMPSKTFVMVLKKLPDHFKNNSALSTADTLDPSAPELPCSYPGLTAGSNVSQNTPWDPLGPP